MPWLTGDNIPVDEFCRVIRVPNDPVFIQAVNGALLDLTYAGNWEQHGTLTPEEQAEKFDEIYVAYTESKCEMIPIGSTMLWHMEEPPAKWLICDGGGYLKTAYPELFALFGAKYGASPDFFGVPDLREKVPYGADFLIPLDATYGEATHTLITSEIPAHQHRIPKMSGTVNAAVNTSTPNARTDNPAAPVMMTDNTGGGGAHNNIQLSYGVYFIVYAGRV